MSVARAPASIVPPSRKSVANGLQQPLRVDGLVEHRDRMADREVAAEDPAHHDDGDLLQFLVAHHPAVHPGARLPGHLEVQGQQVGPLAGWLVAAEEDITTHRKLGHELAQEYGFGQLLWRSRRMKELFDLIPAIAPTDSSVLITSEWPHFSHFMSLTGWMSFV